MSIRWAVRLACVVAMATAGSVALGQSKAPRVKLTFVSSASVIAPNEPFDVALKFELPDGFHIYWENPGDSGLTPKVTWNLPEGFRAGAVRFPAPERHVSSG
ncbi:MAG: thiol:disulfide interchange protein, partial [Planctomycetes bacterium]|nr:thiol:disulfide interchange protein [Planctomycetota bacterium]